MILWSTGTRDARRCEESRESIVRRNEVLICNRGRRPCESGDRIGGGFVDCVGMMLVRLRRCREWIRSGFRALSLCAAQSCASTRVWKGPALLLTLRAYQFSEGSSAAIGVGCLFYLESFFFLLGKATLWPFTNDFELNHRQNCVRGHPL